MDIFKSSLIALIATWFCVWLLRPLAVHIGFVDRPGGRKQHDDDVPLIGGIAMFFGFCFALLALDVSLVSYRGLFAGASLLMLMGVVDDFKELSSKLRIVGQFLAVIFLVVWGNQLIVNLGDLFFFGSVHLGNWAFPITVVAVVGYINAMNMIDGQDGLAGGVALGQVVLLLYLSLNLGRYVDVRLLSILSMMLLVFLYYNMQFPWRKRAAIFMGDSGITFIAFVIAWFAIDVAQANILRIKPVVVLWIVAYPIYDLISVTLMRLHDGRSPFQASRDHLHHILHERGWRVSRSTTFLITLSIAMGCFGLLVNQWLLRDAWQLIAWVLGLIIYLFSVSRLRRARQV